MELEDLEEAYRVARMTPEQEERYLVLKAKITAHTPILERLGLKVPSDEVLAG